MKWIKNNIRKEQGFTLVEIIVVLVVLAILAAFTIPTMLGFVADAKGKAYIAEAREVYVAAQAVATEYNATTNLMDGNNTISGTGQIHSNGLSASLSSFEVQYRYKNYTSTSTWPDNNKPQINASHQMYQYVSADLPWLSTSDTTSISQINLLKFAEDKPIGHRAAWIVTVGQGPDSNTGVGANANSRTGKVTKVVYMRDGYQVTIAGNSASIERYTVPTNVTEADYFADMKR